MKKMDFKVIVFVASIFFLVGFWFHYPDQGLSNYSDLVDTIFYRITPGGIPYVDYNLEYPSLSGIIVYIASMTGSIYGYYYIVASIIYASMMASLWMVYTLLRKRKLSSERILYYIIFTPSFIYFTIYSFDWIGVAFLLLSLFFTYSRKTPFLSGLFMGLSIAARIIPGICIPFMAREFGNTRKMLLFLVSTAASWVAVNLYFMIANWQGFLYPYVYQAGWGVEDSWLGFLPPNYVKIVSLILLLSLVTLLFVRTRRGLLVEACFLALLTFVLTSYKFPPQYMIMLLPFFALCTSRYTLVMAANLLNTMIIIWWFIPALSFGNPWIITSPVQWIAILRQAILVPLLLGYLIQTSKVEPEVVSEKN